MLKSKLKRASTSMAEERAKVKKKPKKKPTVETNDNDDDDDEEHDDVKCLDTTSGASTLRSLLAMSDEASFINDYWEKQPLLIRRNDDAEWLSYVRKLFSLEQLKKLLSTSNHRFQYGRDLNLCRLDADGRKQSLNKKAKNAPLKLEDVTSAFENDKATIQFHQPQRFSKRLWELMERLECLFGSLVGANVYITPHDSQGLPAHHDDIEAFVVQLEGTKRWLLYAPTSINLPDSYELASVPLLGPPTHDITLTPGDILYFPRGVVHQARTPLSTATDYSTHITISTYQKFNTMEFLLSVLDKALQKSFNTNQNLRQGLPIGFFRQNNFNEQAIKELRALGSLDKQSCFPTYLLKDFVRSRLPPYKAKGKSNTSEDESLVQLGAVQCLKSGLRVRLAHREHCFLLTDDDDDDEDEEDDDADDEDDKSGENKRARPKYAVLLHSVANRRRDHMIMSSPDDRPSVNCMVKLPIACAAMMRMLVDNTNNEWLDINTLAAKLSSAANTGSEKSALDQLSKTDTSVLKQALVSLTLENLLQIDQQTSTK